MILFQGVSKPNSTVKFSIPIAQTIYGSHELKVTGNGSIDLGSYFPNANLQAALSASMAGIELTNVPSFSLPVR